MSTALDTHFMTSVGRINKILLKFLLKKTQNLQLHQTRVETLVVESLIESNPSWFTILVTAKLQVVFHFTVRLLCTNISLV